MNNDDFDKEKYEEEQLNKAIAFWVVVMVSFGFFHIIGSSMGYVCNG